MAEESMIRETLHDMEDAALERASGMSPSDRAEFKECVAEVRRRVEAYKPAPAPGAEAAIEWIEKRLEDPKTRLCVAKWRGGGFYVYFEQYGETLDEAHGPTLSAALAALRGEAGK